MSPTRTWAKSSHSDSMGGNCVEARLTRTWTKSSYSTSNGGDCVEARHAGPAVQVRDSKNPDGPVLTFTTTVWETFTAAVKNGHIGT
jgi:hypothetical protein